MTIKNIVAHLESIAPPVYQEEYDNAGLITGNLSWQCTGALVSLDCTEPVIEEAIKSGFNLVIAHHPILFSGPKKINGDTYVEKAIILAIKNDIAIYAIHTNLDNIEKGVNGRMADQLALVNRSILLPKSSTLRKLYTFVPVDHAEELRNALFNTGAGDIGKYSECSFNVEGQGTFKAGVGTNPFTGQQGERHYEKEVRVEVIFPVHLQQQLLASLRAAHPYEEVAFDIVALQHPHPGVGSGMMGELTEAMTEPEFLSHLKARFSVQVVRHTRLLNRKVRKVAICGGAGSFLVRHALAAGADFFVTADMKYHEFFDANDRMVIADIGHFESEQFTSDLLLEILQQKFPTFALLKSKVITNPVNYFMG